MLLGCVLATIVGVTMMKKELDAARHIREGNAAHAPEVESAD